MQKYLEGWPRAPSGRYSKVVKGGSEVRQTWGLIPRYITYWLLNLSESQIHRLYNCDNTI